MTLPHKLSHGLPHIGLDGSLRDNRGGRRHRYMESSDINAASRELFRPLRANIRRGMTIEGQLYAFEVDSCEPGQLLAGSWIPPSTRGISHPLALCDPARRRLLFTQLLAEERGEALFAYITEPKSAGTRRATLYVELVSADGHYAAEHLLRPGRGWHIRDLVQAPVHRLPTA